MKLRVEDWIRIPFDESLSRAGALLACRAMQLAQPANWPPSSRNLLDACASFASELALRRWLETQAVPYQLAQDKPFTQPWYPRLHLGGRRLELQCLLLSSRTQIRHMKRNPSWLLDVKAHVPCHRLSAPSIGENDLVFITILIGLTAFSASDIHKALASDLPIHLVSPTPDQAWTFNPHRTDLGRIDVSCHDPQPFNLDLVGWTDARHIHTETLSLKRGSATSLQKFRSLNYIHPDRLPSTPLVLKAGMLDQDWIIAPHAWKNLWIYGMEVLFAGWLTKRTFIQHAQRTPAGSHMQLGNRLQSESYALTLHKLRPVSKLIERLRQG